MISSSSRYGILGEAEALIELLGLTLLLGLCELDGLALILADGL